MENQNLPKTKGFQELVSVLMLMTTQMQIVNSKGIDRERKDTNLMQGQGELLRNSI